MTKTLRVLLSAAVLASACSETGRLSVEDPLALPVLTTGANATVHWQELEGGFWALKTQDGNWLDPHASLPAEFRKDGLAVRVTARALSDVGCIHMFGQIVEITSISAR